MINKRIRTLILETTDAVLQLQTTGSITFTTLTTPKTILIPVTIQASTIKTPKSKAKFS